MLKADTAVKLLLQRVSEARVEVAGEVVGAIGAGLLVFVGIEPDDNEALTQRMCERLLAYRIFADDQGRMNRSVADIGGGVLLVSQFTLAADTRRGLRPGFQTAAPPAQAQALYETMLQQLQSQHATVAGGQFAADMQVHLINDGPVTIWLEQTTG